ERMYEWLAKDMCEEFPEFKFNKKQIKNKIAKMKPMSSSALKHKKGSGFGSMDETSWKKAITEIYPFFFIMEAGWSAFWRDIKTKPVNTLSNMDEPLVVDAPPRNSGLLDEDVETDQKGGRDIDSEGGGLEDEDEEEEVLVRHGSTYRRMPSATPLVTPSQAQAPTPASVKKTAKESMIKEIRDMTAQ
ncbi:hypothetical protein BG006_004953, partial [Podila minutissima]